MIGHSYIVLGKYIGNAVRIADVGWVEDWQIREGALVAKNEGFDLMWQFSKEPDMEELCERARHGTQGKGVSNMDCMEKLWVLQVVGGSNVQTKNN